MRSSVRQRSGSPWKCRHRAWSRSSESSRSPGAGVRIGGRFQLRRAVRDLAAGQLADPPCLPAGRGDQPGGHRLGGPDVVQPPEQLQPGGLDDVRGLLGGQALAPRHVPQQRVQLAHDLTERGRLAVPGPLEAGADPVRAARPAPAGVGPAATERHKRHATAPVAGSGRPSPPTFDGQFRGVERRRERGATPPRVPVAGGRGGVGAGRSAPSPARCPGPPWSATRC